MTPCSWTFKSPGELYFGTEVVYGSVLSLGSESVGHWCNRLRDVTPALCVVDDSLV